VGVEFARASYLSSSSISYQIHSVNCSGTEDSINQCLLVNNSRLACENSLPASVICQGNIVFIIVHRVGIREMCRYKAKNRNFFFFFFFCVCVCVLIHLLKGLVIHS